MPIHLHQFFYLLIKKGVGTWPEDALATCFGEFSISTEFVRSKGATSNHFVCSEVTDKSEATLV